MRKIGLLIVCLFIALPIALVAVAANAAPIDSSVSGMYLGHDRVCRIVMQRHQTHWVQSDIRCVAFDGSHSASLTTVYAPGICPQSVAYMLNPWPPGAAREYLSLRSYNPAGSVAVVIGGDQTAVANGIGAQQTWFRVAPLASPAPYSCATVLGRNR